MTSEQTADDVPLVVGEDVTWQEVDDLVVLLVLTSGEYFRLDEVGSRAWVVLLERRTVAATVAALESEYDVTPEQLLQDVRRLVDDFLEVGLVRPAV